MPLIHNNLPTPSGRLTAEVAPVRSLHPTAIAEMWHVFSRYYSDVSQASFEHDLAKKNDVILLMDSGDGSLQGFSTIEVYERAIDGRPFVAIFSGDTIIEEAYWGQTTLQRRFVRYVLTKKLQNPTKPVYWYLISKGYKTYLLLSRNFATYYPRHGEKTPAFEQSIIDLLSEDKYPDAYVPGEGVLRFGECPGRLKQGIAPIDTGLLERPDVRFFVDRNPGHAKGEELCCVGRVDLALALQFTSRLLDKWAARISHRARRLWAGATASF